MSKFSNMLLPPKGVKEVMDDEDEIKTFEAFKTTTGGALHSALAVPTQYNRQRGEWRTLPSNELEAVLKKASAVFPGCKTESCTWNDVFERIDAMKEAYDAKAPKGSFRSFIRNGKADATTLNSLCFIIPEEYGLGVLRGGLSFIFQAWEQRIENREKILELLSDVVDTLKATAEMYKVFRDDELKEKTRDLYGVIVDSLRLLTEMLLRCRKDGSFIRRIKTRLPDHEAVVLEGLDHEIQNAKARVTSRIDILNAQTLQNVSKTASANSIELHATRFRVQEVSHCVRRIDGEMKTLNRSVKELKEDIKQDFQRLFEGNMSQMVSKNEVAATVQTLVYNMVAEMVCQTKQPLKQIVGTEVIAEERRLTQQTILMTMEELLRMLGVDLVYLIRETEHILRQSNSLRPKGLGKARWLLTTAQFKNWLSQPLSGILLVDGHCKDDGIGKISPLSVLCASLATTLAQTGSSMILHFFCSSHTRVEQDMISGPSGLIRSLITQLLLYPDSPDVELDPLEQSLYDAVSQYNVRALVSLFGSIVENMDESKTIICIIDGISDFETPLRGWDREILDVVDQLRNLVHSNYEYGRTDVPQCTRWEDDIGMVFRSSLDDAQAASGETCFRSGPGAGPRATQQRLAVPAL
ncbi:uncharacterized protein J4E87_003331 [Alternaria ethzedia]|uniref:uncharacterized protein n=1 Tax=Alternaria ethzedia TaxID=181014 RepID=UPI0020C4E843|nr:uncharacterized protein J4E87_003331 [Alternaria ethzedia]KAI4629071.1 hypothetical protein J4E87_003331 [Alternaria ethzedia]